VFAQLLSLAWEALLMRERQGCRSASIQGDTGDVGDRRICKLRARRVDGCCQHSPWWRQSTTCSPAPRCAFPPSLGFQHA